MEAALAQAESLGGTRLMGPEKVMDTIELGMFNDPEGHMIEGVKAPAQEVAGPLRAALPCG